MLKIFTLVFNLLGLFLCSLFFPVSVNVSQTSPGTIQINNSFLVQVAIQTGNIKGLASFTEQLPKGFTASAVDNAGAKTSFSNNAILFSWDSVSPGGTVNISFRVDVGSAATIQTDTLKGRFLYAVNNQKSETDCLPAFVNVKGAKGGGNSDVKKTDTLKDTPDGGVFVVRQLSSSTISPDSNVTITLILHKAGAKGFAKIEDTLPKGFKAKAIEVKGASFTFDNNIVKFVWPAIPADSVISVSYRIKAGTKAIGMYWIGGNFSYIYNGLPLFYSISRTNFSSTSTTRSSAGVKSVKIENKKPDSTSLPAATESIPATAKEEVSYRVQIMALHNPVDVSYFSSRGKINGTVNAELNNGFTKYTVGNFMDYKSVRDARDDYRNQGISGPFVVSYNSGARITVQEALMITHQQWYK
jgi:hypothetical protein